MCTTLHLISLNGQFLLVVIDTSRVLCILIDGHVVEISPSFSLVTIELRVKCTTFVMQYSFKLLGSDFDLDSLNMLINKKLSIWNQTDMHNNNTLGYQ